MGAGENEGRGSEFKNFSIETVQSHHSEEDGWIIVSGGVYNVTKFLKMHPGGRDVILKYLGKDATEAFFGDIEHSHSTKALRMLNHYQIGVMNSANGTSKVLYNREHSSTSDAKLASLVDMNKAVLPQVMKLNPPDLYHQWLNVAHSASISIRIFQTDVLEACSRWPWWYIFPLWLPVIMYCFLLSTFSNGLIASSFNCVLGWISWAALEYFFHRFLFHVNPKTPWMNFYHFFIHGIHHLTPLDASRLTFPPFFSIALAVLIHSSVAKLAFIWPTYQAWFAGLVTGYLMYDTLHFYFHHGTQLMWFGYLQMMKTRHLRHHYKNSKKNFGVTSPIFDIIFGTSD